ncbi:gliding motility protein GldC [Reichenbachiella agarivorans]|uniref:Gliding motility protein GldC n=1 Tax=Reichenbachiella agarivorans TaxID=2979464 RepID=A0ABY6CV24_9BACT|nr:gliding motility protein GldC [Reichenbachiella agarivorans]UXP33850.1 gliding motility protein GldC [Reichenbachiella agarivorans]
MRKSKITVDVTLDENNVPESIEWSAEDNVDGAIQLSKAISLSFWDDEKKDTLNLDLWTKDMNVDAMKMFYVNMLGSASNTLLNATGDEFMSSEIANLCEKLVEYLNQK